MNDYTHHTAPTQFVEADGIRFAYRRFGKKESVPLVFNQQLMGNIDSWDPSVADGLAKDLTCNHFHSNVPYNSCADVRLLVHLR